MVVGEAVFPSVVVPGLPPCPAVVSHLGPVCVHVSHQFLGQC